MHLARAAGTVQVPQARGEHDEFRWRYANRRPAAAFLGAQGRVEQSQITVGYSTWSIGHTIHRVIGRRGVSPTPLQCRRLYVDATMLTMTLCI
jgi:hypothetical protein